MVKLVHEEGGPSAARQRWIREFGMEKVPAVSTFTKMAKKFEENEGCIKNRVRNLEFNF